MLEEQGRRARKKAETRAALIDAAFRLFRTHGYGATTVEDVAEAAGVSRRTAFRYFPTKEELVFPQTDELLGTFEELLAPEPEESPFATVRRACLSLARTYMERRHLFVTQDAIIRDEPALLGHELQLDKHYEALIARALGRGRETRRSRVWAGAILGAVRAVLREWLDGGGETDLVRLGREAFGLLEDGAG